MGAVSMAKKKKTKKPQLSAKTSDKHILYELAVQSPEAEIDFADRLYRQHFKRSATRLREDFCGTALVACEWATKRPDNIAYAVDLDKPTLDWGMEHNVSMLPEDAISRVHLIHDDVLNVVRPKVEMILALNFSYFLFLEWDQLVGYFKQALRSLDKEGMLILDSYGGYEAQQVMEEKRKLDGFTYIWDQASYNPINDHCTCNIHFSFPDGTMMRKAFNYRWRLWTLGAIRDALRAAGFQTTKVYWEGDDGKGSGNGLYHYTEKAANCPGWNAYIVATP